MSAAQLAWLQQQLGEAEAAGERVIVGCHLCFHPRTCAPTCLMWNYSEVLDVSVWVGVSFRCVGECVSGYELRMRG